MLPTAKATNANANANRRRLALGPRKNLPMWRILRTSPKTIGLDLALLVLLLHDRSVPAGPEDLPIPTPLRSSHQVRPRQASHRCLSLNYLTRTHIPESTRLQLSLRSARASSTAIPLRFHERRPTRRSHSLHLPTCVRDHRGLRVLPCQA